jgi:protein tyrosine/serine phosphatase
MPARALRGVGVVLLAAILCLGGYLLALRLSGNFHTVVAAQLYRSAQPSAERIARYKAEYGIRTIINLRGDNAGRHWYDTEIAEARKLDIAHIDFRMSAKRELTREQARALVAIMARAEKPVLIHCDSGADRSGLAAALYVAALSKGGERAAEDQIGIRFGHLSLPVVRSYAIDRSWEALEPWLGFGNS